VRAPARWDQQLATVFYRSGPLPITARNQPGPDALLASTCLMKVPMKKVDDYRQHAAECRQMANRFRSPLERDMLVDMANTWDSLASDRESQIARQRRLAALEGGPLSIPIDQLNASNDD
jgi:hypothetical protein